MKPLIRYTDELHREALTEWQTMKKKPNLVYMKKLTDWVEVETNEGVLSARPGDYLAFDPVSQHVWPVAASYVEIHYEEV